MERFRNRIALFAIAWIILLPIAVKWYGNLDYKRVYTDEYKNYLSDTEKIQRFGPSNIDNYNAYYSQTKTIEETRTNIPFVWNYKVLEKTPMKVFTE